MFKLWGPKGKQASHRPKVWNTDLADFEAWRVGQTGNPMIDANMRELLHTGFMSNRGRQIVASYLTRDMGMDWRSVCIIYAMRDQQRMTAEKY